MDGTNLLDIARHTKTALFYIQSSFDFLVQISEFECKCPKLVISLHLERKRETALKIKS